MIVFVSAPPPQKKVLVFVSRIGTACIGLCVPLLSEALAESAQEVCTGIEAEGNHHLQALNFHMDQQSCGFQALHFSKKVTTHQRSLTNIDPHA